MKNLRKIIAFFLLIFFTGIIITVISINTTLDKKKLPLQTSETKKDSILKSKKVKGTSYNLISSFR